MKLHQYKHNIKISFSVFAVLLIVIAGCKAFDNSDDSDSKTLKVDLSSISQQVGYPVESRSENSDGKSEAITVPGDTPATDAIKSLLEIGRAHV